MAPLLRFLLATASVLGCGAPSPPPVPVCPRNSVWNGLHCVSTQVVVPVPAAPTRQGACAARAAGAPSIPVTDPSAKARAEQALYSSLEPRFRACLATAPATRFEIRVEFAPTGRPVEVIANSARTEEVDCVTRVIETEACMPPVQEGWRTAWVFCARGCADNPYCKLCLR